jgi:hypothetical protein
LAPDEANREVKYRIDWIDRETLAYRAGELSVFVWVDFEPSIFSRGRVLHTDSINQWIDAEFNGVRTVTQQERDEIIGAIRQYYQLEGRPCTLEP